jgi:P27 family predicted phage terminase small subunit
VTHSTPAAASRKPRPVAPTRPDWLTPFGQQVWDRVVRELEPLGLLAPVDREVLAAYCDAAAFAREARDRLVADGLTQIGQKGETVKSPVFQIWRQSVSVLESFGTRLGLNPSARLRMFHELDDPDDDDSLLD